MSIYLDYNATNPLMPDVLRVINEVLEQPVNPSSVHSAGRRAKKYVEDARQLIANTVSCWPDELIFTASGTEANATALVNMQGANMQGANMQGANIQRDILIGATEHSSIISTLPRGGVSLIPVDSNGFIDLSVLDKMLVEQSPAWLSIMLSNNETGVIQPIAEIAGLCKKHGVLLHCDAAQALGKIPVDVGALGVDMMTLSAHKCGGPVGAAALIVRRSTPFTPLFSGGGQEGRRRAGTENVAAIAGFAKAVELYDLSHMKALRGWLDRMEADFIAAGATVFGLGAKRLPNTTCVAMPNVSNEVQLMDFDLNGFCVSAGSACSSGRVEISHVLLAMGISRALAQNAIRISGGWNTKEEDIKAFSEAWHSICERLANKNAIA